MTIDELGGILENAMPGKVTYHSWPVNEAPPLPYICYLEADSDNFAADNIVYHARREVTIELYSKYKDLAAEAALEAVLTAAEIYYETSDTYLAKEECFERLYFIEV